MFEIRERQFTAVHALVGAWHIAPLCPRNLFGPISPQNENI
jgi:hypothetical protein